MANKASSGRKSSAKTFKNGGSKSGKTSRTTSAKSSKKASGASKKRKTTGSSSRKTRRKVNDFKRAAGTLGLIVGCLLCIIALCIEKGVFDGDNGISLPTIGGAPVSWDSKFDFGVMYLNVGQGDCELIVSGKDAVLIDGGEAVNGKKIRNTLSSLGINKLSYVIATHPHSDHIGGLPEVIDNIEVGKVIAPRIAPEKTPTTDVYEKLIESVKDKGLKLTAAKPGTVYELDGGAEMEILAPTGDSYSDLNDYSVVCRVTKGKSSFLFTGDASERAEKDILESGRDISAKVLKAGHHGSRTASSEEFLNEVHPRLCVISCGTGNDYGHPHDEAVSRMEEAGASILRTDRNGTVTVYSDGEKLYITTERE